MPRLALAAVLAVASLAGCAKHAAEPAPVRPVVTYRVALGATQLQAAYSGEVRARHEADLGFRVGGKVVSRHVDVGAVVAKGTLIAKLDPSDARLAAEAAQSQVAAAETEYNYARAEHDRYERLLAQNFVGRSVYDAKLSALKAAQARLAQARSNYAVSRNQSDYTTLTADQDGVVTAVSAEAGQVVAAGQPVVRVARLEEREVAISVPESRLPALTGADSITVELFAAPGKRYVGKVREVAPNADPATRTFGVRVAVADADAQVRLGMTANVTLAGDRRKVALLPLAAIYSHDSKAQVWVVDPQSGKVNLRAVQVAAYREDGVTVTQGVSEGELVVAAGVHSLNPGQVVRVSEEVHLQASQS